MPLTRVTAESGNAVADCAALADGLPRSRGWLGRRVLRGRTGRSAGSSSLRLVTDTSSSRQSRRPTTAALHHRNQSALAATVAAAERDLLRPAGELDQLQAALTVRTEPMIPERVVVREARAAGDFYGWYPAGERVYEAYQEIATQLAGGAR